MNHKMKRATLCFALILFIFTCIPAQEKTGKTDVPDPSRIASVNDHLYYGKGLYVLDRSFLSPFEGYKKLFSDLPYTCILQTLDVRTGYRDKEYRPVWLVKDTLLYLSDIRFYDLREEIVEEIYPHKSHYQVLKRLTGVPFRKESKSGIPRRIPQSPLGMMPATWVTGVFLARTIMTENDKAKRWENSGFLEMTFRNGRLISVRKFSPVSSPHKTDRTLSGLLKK